jgi:hypothetical protein
MSIFRVRNLLIQVLEPMTCETDSACAQNISGEPAICGEGSLAADLQERWACGCSLHFDTGCNIWRFSLVCRSPGITLECVPGGVTLVNKADEIAGEPCPDPNSGCQILVSLPLCPKITDTGCEKIVNSGVVLETPMGVCFRSDEPRLNPNSLADLGVLRRQLALGLEIVERRERALAEALTPRTQDQIEKAEAILRVALEDLQNSKQHIQSRASAATKTSKKTAAKKSAPRKGGAGK